MKTKLDESNRINRIKRDEAVQYLTKKRGEEYCNYRKDWEFYSTCQEMPDRPLQLNLEITSNCNLRCAMCFRSYEMNNPRKSYLSVEELKRIFAQFDESKIPSLWISGGEPFLHPNIDWILKEIATLNPLDSWIVSNGFLLSDEIIEGLLDSGIHWLSISIDASTAETYRKIRGGDLLQLENNIDNFLKRRNERDQKLPFLRVTFIDMPSNHHEINDFISNWRKRADIVDIQSLADYHNLDSITEEEMLNCSFMCTAPFTLISVIPDGNFIPCCNGFYDTVSSFNINNVSIKEYWNSPWRLEFAKSLKEKRYCYECKKCIKSFVKREQI